MSAWVFDRDWESAPLFSVHVLVWQDWEPSVWGSPKSLRANFEWKCQTYSTTIIPFAYFENRKQPREWRGRNFMRTHFCRTVHGSHSSPSSSWQVCQAISPQTSTRVSKGQFGKLILWLLQQGRGLADWDLLNTREAEGMRDLCSLCVREDGRCCFLRTALFFQ